MAVLEHAVAQSAPAGVHLRAIRDDDAERLRRMFTRCSRDTIYRRFFTYAPTPPEWMLRRLAHVDHVNRYAVVAAVGDEVVGVARFDKVGRGDEAEIAVCVEDAWQRRGVARSLMTAVLDAARRRGVVTVTADMQADNGPARTLVTALLPHAEVTPSGTTYTIRASL